MTRPTTRHSSRRPPDAVITITGGGAVVDLNEGAERMFRVRREEALQKPVAHVLATAEQRAPELAELGAALSEDPSRLLDRELEVTASGPDGRPFTVELTVARAGVDAPLFIVWIRDISERRVAETESERRLAMLEQGEEGAGIGSWDWDLRTDELRWSDNMFRLFGLNPRAFTPTREVVVEHTYADDRDLVRQRGETAMATGQMGMLEFRIVRADGAVRRMQSIVASVEQEDGVSRRFLGTVQDVTERRQIAREIAGHIAIEEVLAAWASLEDGTERLLARLGEAMEFAVGVLWLRSDDALDALDAGAFWNSGSTEVPELETAARPLVPAPGQALSVEAWLSRQPVVVASLADAPAFLGRDTAIRAGLRGAVALPAVSGDRAFAVLEFYSRENLQFTETLLRSLTRMGQALGYFFARRGGELRPRELTPREREVLQLAAQGMARKAIARQLSLSPSTVKTHFENIYAKWCVSDRASAVAKALREGVIQ
jgi:PAS domain S-box-containing protein